MELSPNDRALADRVLAARGGNGAGILSFPETLSDVIAAAREEGRNESRQEAERILRQRPLRIGGPGTGG